MTPRLYRVILPVRELDAAQRFYETLLGTAGERVSHGRWYFDCGGVVLALLDRAAEGEGEQRGPNPETVYFSTAELEGVRIRALAAGATATEIVARPRGETSFYVDDPWGNPLCFVAEGTEFTGGRFVP